MNEILDKYINHTKTIYENKKLKQFEYSKRIIFTAKNGRNYTLKDVNEYKQKTKSSVLENEVSSILRVLYNNIVIYQTATTHSKYNIKASDKSSIRINGAIKKQYEKLKGYHRHRWQFKSDNSRLKARNIKIYELTKALNLHSNTVDVLNSKEQLNHYIKALVCARRKYDVGRVELLVNKHTLKQIKKLFVTGVVVRIKNKDKVLYLREEGEEFILGGLGDRVASGNYIYFKALDSSKDSKRRLLRYFYKNILFERYKNMPTKEHTVFSKLGIRIKQFSKDFFRRKVPKSILYRTSNKLYLLFKSKDKNTNLKLSRRDMKSFIYFSAMLFKKNELFKLGGKIFFLNSKDKILDLFKYK